MAEPAVLSYKTRLPCLRKARSGFCPFDDSCDYAASHDWPDDLLRSRSVCKFFRANVPCSYSRCLWLHEDAPRELCYFYNLWGTCKYGSLCKFEHIDRDSPPSYRAGESPGASANNDEDSPAGKPESKRRSKETKHSPANAPNTSSTSQKTHEPSAPKPSASSEKPRTTKESKPSFNPPPNQPHPKSSGSKEREVPKPKFAQPTLGAQGIQAYQRGDYKEAIAVFDKLLQRGNLDRTLRISTLSNRAHALEKLFLQTKDASKETSALEDCEIVATLCSGGHFKTSMLQARIFLRRESFDFAITHCKNASRLANGIQDDKVRVLDLLDSIMSAKIAWRRKQEEEERRLEEEKRKKAQQDAINQAQLHEFETMTPREILGVSHMATSAQVKLAYRKLAMKYHPDRPGGDHQLFQKVEEAFRSLSI